MPNDSYDFDRPYVPLFALAWLIAVAGLAETPLVGLFSRYPTSAIESFFLVSFFAGLSSCLLRNFIITRFRVGIKTAFFLITFVAIALTSLWVAVAISSIALALDATVFRRGKGMVLLLKVQRAGAFLGSIYGGACVAQLLAWH